MAIPIDHVDPHVFGGNSPDPSALMPRHLLYIVLMGVSSVPVHSSAFGGRLAGPDLGALFLAKAIFSWRHPEIVFLHDSRIVIASARL